MKLDIFYKKSNININKKYKVYFISKLNRK